jgi:hypothetical protein
MDKEGQNRGKESKGRTPIAYGKLRTEAETALLLLTAERVSGVTVDVSKTPGDSYRDVPVFADPEVISATPESIVPPGFNFVTLTFPQDPNTFVDFWENYNDLRMRFVEQPLGASENGQMEN